MLKFQEDTVRFLFRMQIIGPDGQPVTAVAAPRPRREVPKAPPVASAALPAPQLASQHDGAPPREIAIPTRSATLHHHRCSRKGIQTEKAARACRCQHGRIRQGAQPAQRRTGEKVGRNDPCPCGSGKKYKKCHGTEQ